MRRVSDREIALDREVAALKAECRTLVNARVMAEEEAERLNGELAEARRQVKFWMEKYRRANNRAQARESEDCQLLECPPGGPHASCCHLATPSPAESTGAPRAEMYCTACGGRCDGPCEEGDEQFAAEAAPPDDIRERPIEQHVHCRGCGHVLRANRRNVADGCICNSGRGINHGIVPRETCTCTICDPAQTGSARPKDTSVAKPAAPREQAGHETPPMSRQSVELPLSTTKKTP